jgi:hypothetical protein
MMGSAWSAAGATLRAEDCGSIDSNRFARSLDHSWFGISVEASFLLLLLVMAATHIRGPRAAVALLLLIVNCVVASITETRLGNAPPYLPQLMVAALLLAPEASRRMR